MAPKKDCHNNAKPDSSLQVLLLLMGLLILLHKSSQCLAKLPVLSASMGIATVGGCRASTYNAVPLEACQALAAFMQQYQQSHQ